MPLLLTRASGQSVVFSVDGREIRVQIVRVHGRQVRLALIAPDDVAIRREDDAPQHALPAEGLGP